MTQKEIYQTLEHIHNLLYQSRIKEALETIDPLIQASGVWEQREQAEQLRISYGFMLQYLSQGILDPKRNEVLDHIINQLHSLADSVAIALLENESNEVFFVRRRELKNSPLDEMVQAHRSELNKFSLLASIAEDQRDTASINNVLTQRELHETAIFNKLWSTFPTNPNDAELITGLINDPNYPDYVKSLLVSALFLGLLKVYDERKLILLIDAYTTSDSSMVQMRALISALLIIKLHQKRVEKSRALASHIQAMRETEGFTDDLATVQFQLVRSRNTENITRRVKEDLMPNIMKLRPDMLQKMNDPSIDFADLEANPEWQEMLENSGLAKKMEEFNELQLEGSDVFIATFSKLKTFPFFQTLSNWFIPFHDENSAIYTTFSGDDAPLRIMVARAPFLCNSDRYSFCLSLQSMPQSQRQLIAGQIKAQIEQVGEMESADLPNARNERESQANMYVHDLYRFFKLFSRRREFTPVFDDNFDFANIPLIGNDACRPESLTLVAEFYFKNGFYDDAIRNYNYLLAQTDNADPHIFQKLGFCHQSLGNIQEALKQYQHYELADDHDLWTIKHIATCNRLLKNYDQALTYYRMAEEMRPDNVANIINMGHCLLEQGKTEEALQCYFKADLMPDNKHKARRPIAWCSFLIGNDERSLEYYNRIINEDNPTAQDYLNQGHVLLATNQIPVAIKSYQKALALMKMNSTALRDLIMADKKSLSARGINCDDLPLIIDAVITSQKQ